MVQQRMLAEQSQPYTSLRTDERMYDRIQKIRLHPAPLMTLVHLSFPDPDERADACKVVEADQPIMTWEVIPSMSFLASERDENLLQIQMGQELRCHIHRRHRHSAPTSMIYTPVIRNHRNPTTPLYQQQMPPNPAPVFAFL